MVADDGRGVPRGILDGSGGADAAPGIGIRGMQERMRQLGGRLEIDSGSRGTPVRARRQRSRNDSIRRSGTSQMSATRAYRPMAIQVATNESGIAAA